MFKNVYFVKLVLTPNNNSNNRLLSACRKQIRRKLVYKPPPVCLFVRPTSAKSVWWTIKM